MRKTLIIGAQGQLGRDLMRILAGTCDLIPTDVDQCDITDPVRILELMKSERPDVVINTAAWTDVPGCEADDKKAFTINALGAKNVAVACGKFAAKLVHVSTDYVFDGKKTVPYVESDRPSPLNVYGISKLSGEYYVAAYCTSHVIVRTSGLYGIHPAVGKKTNFVETMLKLAKEKEVIRVVNDEILTPTFTVHLARQIKAMIDKDHYGLFHATNNGACSWFQFAEKIFELTRTPVKLEPTTVAEFGSAVRRPAYSVLRNDRLEKMGMDLMTDWDEALRDYFLDKENKLTLS